MNIVIPMAGRGARFAEAGFKLPKPLIQVNGLPMYERALQSLPLHLCSRLIFICLEQHLIESRLRDTLLETYERHDPTIVSVDEVTAGQAATVLLAKKYICNSDPLLIHNTDTCFKSGLSDLLENIPPEIDGIVTVFKAVGERWSFASINDAGFVTRVEEKNPISEWGTVGMYFFSRGDTFVETAEKMIADNLRINGEFYVAPVYNLMIERGKRIIPDYAEQVGCMGTPEDLVVFLEK